MKKILFLFFISTIYISCEKDKEINLTDQESNYEIGKNQFFTTVDGNSREYYVHVPESYNKNTKTPVVFMLHGTSGDGNKFYNISGWKEVGEVENIITIFPSSGQYCIIDDGVTKNITKWNVYPGTYTYCSGVNPMNDIKFFRQIISELHQNFNVDIKKTYLVGFSNGGQMAFRSAVEMGDVFAAIVGSAGWYGATDTTFVPVRREIPITFQLGNKDEVSLGSGANFPLIHFDSLMNNLPSMKNTIYTSRTTFGFDSTYTKSGTISTTIIATFKSNPFVNNRVFNFVLFNDLAHNYPNGINHPAKGAEINWKWMKQYTLP